MCFIYDNIVSSKSFRYSGPARPPPYRLLRNVHNIITKMIVLYYILLLNQSFSILKSRIGGVGLARGRGGIKRG